MEEGDKTLEGCFEELQKKLDGLVSDFQKKTVDGLLQEQVQVVETERALTTLSAQQIADYNDVGLANVRLSAGVESQQYELLDRMVSLCLQGSSKFADDLVTDTEKILLKQVEMSGKVLESSLVTLSDQIYRKKKEMMTSYDEEEISNLMDTHFVTLKKYYEMISHRAREMRDKYEEIYFAQELESISRQSKEMEAMKNRFRNNNKMEEHREDAHKAADQLFRDFADKVLKLKVSNSNMKEDQEMRMKETISKSKHWRFEYSHKLESSLQKRIKHADELYLRTIERLDHELETLKKFRYATDMDTVRVKHLSNTPRFASRRYMEEARQIANAAPTKPNLAKLEAYNFKLGNRYVDLATYTRIDTEKQAEDLQNILYESLIDGHRHHHRHHTPSDGELHLQGLIRRMIEESQAKLVEREQQEKLAKTLSRRGGARVAGVGTPGGERPPVLRLSKGAPNFV